MKKYIFKLISLLFITIVLLVGMSNASLKDEEKGAYSSFTASSLDIRLLSESGDAFDGHLLDESRVKSKDEVSKTIKLENDGEIDVEYWGDYKYVSGNEDVCGGMDVEVVRNGEEVYSGTLDEYSTATQAAGLSVGEQDTWKYTFSREGLASYLQGQECAFDIDYKAYLSAADLGGFYDTESISNSVGYAYEAELDAEHDGVAHKFNFSLLGLSNFQSFIYSLKYTTDTKHEEVSGVENLSGENTKMTEILLGTCSTDSCVYDSNPHDFDLQVSLLDIDGYISTLSAQL